MMIPTKTIVPNRQAHVLRRQRLIDRLRSGLGLALTLVTAPAGYGKTSLLIDFAGDAPLAVCWLSLDADDRDLSTFTEYLVAALQRRFPEFGRTTRGVLDGSRNLRCDPVTLTGALVQDMLDAIQEPFVLVLDDYHRVEDSAEVNALLTRLLLYRPDHFHLILASRTEPTELPMIQLVAHSQVVGVGARHLAFLAEEIQSFLAHAHGIPVTISEAEELATESEGWITAILLSTEALWRGIRDNLVRAKDQGVTLYSYLAEQVFAGQPPQLRDFLLASSTLPEMNEVLCREALGLDRAAEMLKEIERRGVFVTRVVDKDTGTWYQYHHLFREFLQSRLQTHDAGRFQQLHQRAADWFEAREQWERAVHHRRAAGDMRAMARTMDAALTSVMAAGRLQTLLDWCEMVPFPLRSEFPRLLLYTGRALNNLGQVDKAVKMLRRAETEFTRLGDTERALYAALARAETWNLWGRYADAQPLTEEILAKATDYPFLAADAHRLDGLACLDLGRPKAAVEHFRACLDLHRELGHMRETAIAYTDLSLALLRLGQMSEGWACQDRAVELYRKLAPSSAFAAILNNIACERYYLTGAYGPALDYLEEAIQVTKAAGVSLNGILAFISKADLYRDLGALDQATELYHHAETMARQMGHFPFLNFATLGIAQTHLLRGKVAEALGLAAQARDDAQRRQDAYQLGLAYLALGAARLEAGDPRQALEEIRHGCKWLNQCGAQRELARAHMLLARALTGAGEAEPALDALNQALDIGIGTQTWHYLVVEGQRAYDLLKRLHEQNPADRRLVEVVERIRAFPDASRAVVGGLSPGALPYPPTLRFYAFGPARVERAGELIGNSAWHSAQARYLFFYLLVHPPKTRNQIAACFWPDRKDDRVKATFQVVKCQANEALGRALIVFQDGRYGVEMEPDCWFDVAAFDSLLRGQDHRQTRLEAAVALYQGDFLEGYDAEWCVPIREGLHQRFRDALVELGEIHTQMGQLEPALTVLNRALAVDDLHERTYRALMQALARKGDIPAALQRYHELVERLRREMHIDPDPETQQLYQLLRRGKNDRRS